MASLAETLAAQPNPQFGEGLMDAVKTGIGLAQSKQQLEMQKQQVTAQKEALAQQQMNGLGNRLRAAAFSTDKAIFESRLKQAKAYADQSNIPFNEQAFRDLYGNDQTRLVLQNGIRDVMTGKVPVKPEEFLGVIGSQEGLYNWGEAGIIKNSDTQNKNEQAMELLNQKLAHRAELDAAKAETAAAKTEYKQGKDVAEAVNKAKADFDKAVNDDLQALGQADKAESLLLSGGSIAGEAAKSVVARMFEKGVLTDADVSRLSGGRALVDQGERLVQKMYDGKLTAEDQKQLLKITQTLKPVLQNKIRDRAKREAIAKEKAYKTMGISATQFMDSYAVDNLLGGPAEAAAPAPKEKAPAPAQTKRPASDIVKQFAGKKSPEVIAKSLTALGYSPEEIKAALGGQ